MNEPFSKPDIMYVAAMRLPSERAHSAQVMHTAAAFAALGKRVELVVPLRKGSIDADPFEYYKIPKTENLSIAMLRVPDTIHLGRMGFWFHQRRFGTAVRKYAEKRKPSFIYSRDEFVLYAIRNLGIPFAWESHQGRYDLFARSAANAAQALIVISEGLKERYQSLGIPPHKITVADDGIDLFAFANPESSTASRRRLGLMLEQKIAMYVGSLEEWKGYRTFLLASRMLPDVQCVVIGGKESEIAPLKAEFPNVLFLGFLPYADLPNNQSAADVLVVPNTATDPLSSKFTSPLKLFAHMASGRAIVASDVPSIREVVGDDEAFFVSPDDPESLAQGITTALGNTSEATRRAANAKKRVQRFSWEARAKAIIVAIEKR
jgi:glycosyltransferase involved in cell wall biosynthesis